MRIWPPTADARQAELRRVLLAASDAWGAGDDGIADGAHRHRDKHRAGEEPPVETHRSKLGPFGVEDLARFLPTGPAVDRLGLHGRMPLDRICRRRRRILRASGVSRSQQNKGESECDPRIQGEHAETRPGG